MYRSLQPSALGVQVSGLAETLELAARHRFEGCHFSIIEVAELGVARVKTMAASSGVRLSLWRFPVNFRGEDAEYERDLNDLRRLVAVADELDVRRTATWIAPASDELSYDENFSLHTRRLRPAAEILTARGIRLGLEYVAPQTSRKGKRHEFIHTMDQMASLCEALGPNVGFLLDSWHWYTAQEDATHLQRLSASQVVDVHVNDAPERPVLEQLDGQRCLPGETGVIDIATFLRCLGAIGYDGPVMAEPFSAKLAGLDREAACAMGKAALDKVWAQAGI